MAYTFDSFKRQSPRILPVIIAVDTSGSMSVDGKIEALNLALNNFLNSIKGEGNSHIEIDVAIYTFGREVTCNVELQKVESIEPQHYEARGKTPLGLTLKIIKQLIEDKEKIPSRSYRPTVVIISDGMPTDDFTQALNDFKNEGRSSKSFRIAMAIGDDANKEILGAFVSDPSYLVEGESAGDIHNFFQFVTMSVTQRTRSQNPDKPITAGILDSDDVMEL